jgi:PadR family transcriptional regulator PadR
MNGSVFLGKMYLYQTLYRKDGKIYGIVLESVMDILQGTLDLLILRALEIAPMHGIGIASRIHQVTHGTFVVKAGSLFPAVRRLEQQGWIEGEWGPSENNRRARYYSLTRTGRAQLAREKRDWRRMTSAMNWMLESEG